MFQFTTLVALLLVLAAQQDASAQSCPPTRGDLGVLPGRYPPGSVGMPWLRFVTPQPELEPTNDDFESFNRTRLRGPVVALLVTPFAEDPTPPYRIDGYVTPDGGSSPNPPTGATRSPTRETRRPTTSSPTRETRTPTTSSPTRATRAPSKAPTRRFTRAPTRRPTRPLVIATRSPTRPLIVGRRLRGEDEEEVLEDENDDEVTSEEEEEEDEDALTEDEIKAALDEHRGRDLNVFSPDTRTEVNVANYPYRAVGKWRGCTASLVYASGIVVTNAHCLKYREDGTMDPSMWSRTFMAGFKNNAFLAASTPKAIWYDKDWDYAVLKLHSNIDATVGRLGCNWRSKSFFNTNRVLSMISYSGDHCTSGDNCRPKLSTGSSRGTRVFSEDVKHDLDATRGSSGSAMWKYYSGVPVMDALNWGEDRNGGENSLFLGSYTGNNPNLAKPSHVWWTGYNKVKNY